jgi:hypothetical protein
MINSIETYRDAGMKAGRARRNRDESGAQFHSDWHRRAVALEKTPEDKAAAQKAFTEGYKSENCRPVSYFN